MLAHLISLLPDQVFKLMCDQRAPLSLCNCVVNIDIICPGEFLPICKSVTKNSHSCPLHSHPSAWLLSLSLLTSRGRWGVGERPFLRVSHAALQSHPQLAGALPHEPQLRSHRQVVRQTLREGREAHQQEVSWLHVFTSRLCVVIFSWPCFSSCSPPPFFFCIWWSYVCCCWLWCGRVQLSGLSTAADTGLQFYVLFSV